MKTLKSRLLLFLSLFLCVSILLSCGSDDPKRKYDIYAFGYSSAYDLINGRPRSTAYWKNGEEFTISDGSINVSLLDMDVSNGDVYIAGAMRSEENKPSVATYWKNGVPVNLSDGTKNEVARGIAVIGSDVYVCGYEVNEAGDFVPKYWKNGQATILPASYYGAADRINVTGSDLHVMGWQTSVDTVYAMYWKNGKVVVLPPKKSYALYSDMVIDGSDVYLAGYDGDINGGMMTGKVWKNGSELMTLNNNSYTSGMAVSGGDVYVAAANVPGYWKNKDFIEIPKPAGAHRLYSPSIAVAGGDVINVITNTDNGGILYGTYLLINGTAQAPFTGDGGKIELVGIVVK